MKYSDLPVKELDEIKVTSTYIICSNFSINEEDEHIEGVNKWLLDVTKLASQSDLVTLSEQTSQMIKLLNQIVNKQQDLEKQINILNNSKIPDFSNIQEELDKLKERIEDNVIEL